MEKVNFQQSLKNIPAPENKIYEELLIIAIGNTVKAFRNKANAFKNKYKNKKETYGIKSAKNPDKVAELKNFELDLINLAKNVKYKKFNNRLQENLRIVCNNIKNQPNLIVPADKTSNFYVMPPDKHEELRKKDVQNNFKKVKKDALAQVNNNHKLLAQNLNIDDRLFQTSVEDCFVKVKDHKSNFRENPQVRTINPAKPELGRVSKKILDEKIHVIRQKSGLNQWKNTNAALKWFNNIRNKSNMSFIVFDVEQFYPSIDEKLLRKTITWCKKYVDFTEEEIEVVIAARKAMLYMNGEIWSKKGGGIFDVGMGSYDGAEICEIVGLFLLSELSHLGLNIGLYRDDGLAVSNKSPKATEALKKKMSAIFKKHKLKITIEANKKRVEFLDVYLDLEKEEYGPYLKPSDTPIYVSAGSNHPPKVLENIPKGVNKRLSTISSSQAIFEKAAPVYQNALEKAGYNYKLHYEHIDPETEGGSRKRKNRKRKIIWFNPPFSHTVKTNVGAEFLKLVRKHFPKEHPFHTLFNKNNVKTSYRCTPNLNRKISAHNKKILAQCKPDEGEGGYCDCTKRECPVEGKCYQSGVIYNATVEREDGIVDTYIGLSEPPFKQRFRNHISNFKTRNPKSACSLNKYIWDLQDKNIKYDIKWKIVGRARSFNPLTGTCYLCTREKYFILYKPEMATINSQEEILGPCLHKHNKLLRKVKNIN